MNNQILMTNAGMKELIAEFVNPCKSVKSVPEKLFLFFSSVVASPSQCRLSRMFSGFNLIIEKFEFHSPFAIRHSPFDILFSSLSLASHASRLAPRAFSSFPEFRIPNSEFPKDFPQ